MLSLSKNLQEGQQVNNESENKNSKEDDVVPEIMEEESQRQSLRKRVTKLARNIVIRPLSAAAPMPQAVASVLKDATLQALDLAVDEVIKHRPWSTSSSSSFSSSSYSQAPPSATQSVSSTTSSNKDSTSAPPKTEKASSSSSLSLAADFKMDAVIEEAFGPVEQALDDMETLLRAARASLVQAKAAAMDAVEAVQAAAIAQAKGAASAVVAAEQAASETVLANIYAAAAVVAEENAAAAAAANEQQLSDSDSSVSTSSATAGTVTPVSTFPLMNVTNLRFEDVDYETSEMAPPFLGEDQCLVPGEPVIRVEKALENSRRIFAGIDIMASVDTVWKVLTDYAHLQDVVPNLVVNEVMELYEPTDTFPECYVFDETKSEQEQCQSLSKKMKGALLRQVGGAKVAGIQFSARTTLEVREWPQGLPDYAHYESELYQGKSRKERAVDNANIKLQRYRFPRPFAVSSLPTKDISMQSIENDDGEFRMYQGVWRMQPLPGCAPPGKQAMRLTYAVEVSPRAYLPVQLVEGRIVRDLRMNLQAIRDYVAKVEEGQVQIPSTTKSSAGAATAPATVKVKG